MVVGPPGRDGETVAERETLPRSPKLLTVIVEVVEPVATNPPGPVRVADIVKSPVTFTVMVIEWDSEPLVPLTVTEYVPARVEGIVVMVRFEPADPPATNETVAGLIDVARLEEGLVTLRVKVPVRPALDMRILDDPTEPALMVRMVELLVMVKFPVTVIVRVAWRFIEPLVPVTVTV